MGEYFKRKRAASFTHQADRAVAEFSLPNLFSNRPEVRFTSFNCEPREEGAREGADVGVVLAEEEVQVWLGPVVVGVVREPDDADGVRELMAANPECAGMLPATIIEVSSMTGDFAITLDGAGSDEPHD